MGKRGEGRGTGVGPEVQGREGRGRSTPRLFRLFALLLISGIRAAVGY